MASELRAVSGTGGSIYCHIIDQEDSFWNGASLESYSSANYSSYAVSLSEVGSTGIYTADFPSALTTPGRYEIIAYRRLGASPVEGTDVKVGTQVVQWSGTESITVGQSAGNLTGSELRAVTISGKTVYSILMNGNGRVWNGSDQVFEAFNTANYSDYAVTLTEKGSSGIYFGDFPAGITTEDTYEVFHFLIITGSTPAEGSDPVAGTQSVVWTGSAAVTTSVAVGAYAGSDLYNYFVRTFKRTDKETEFYDALTDTINEIVSDPETHFSEMEKEVNLDGITTLGEFKFSVEPDTGLLIGNVFVIDGQESYELKKLSKPEFDAMYVNPYSSSVNKGYPESWCYFGGYIWIGPVPDSVSYGYRANFSRRLTQAISATTDPVPLSIYRETLKFGCLFRVFQAEESYDKAQYWEAKYLERKAIDFAREKHNRRTPTITKYRGVC